MYPLLSLPSGDTTYRLPSAPAENLGLPVEISSPFYKHNEEKGFLYDSKGVGDFVSGRGKEKEKHHQGMKN
jgi:DNA-binding transcriptional regulator YhcF (GntR family)